MNPAIGIDLGTTNTVVAAVRDGRAVTLKDEQGRSLLPSIVSFHPSGNVIVGEAAKERRVIDAKNTISSVKRLIGRGWQSKEVQEAAARAPFVLKEGDKDTTVVVARGVEYTLPEISAFVLRRAKALAEAALGETVTRAVVTVPANFNELQRAATKTAARIAGLDVLRILNEPTAAAVAYGQSSAGSERMAIYDLGGGTFDITLLDSSDNVFEVLATAGDSVLGGDDIDTFIADWVSAQVLKMHRFDPHADPEAYGRLRIVAEQAKILLSQESEAHVDVPELGYGPGGKPLHIRFKVTRDAVERLAAPLVDKTIAVSQACIEQAGRTKDSLDRVILVGGATRMPIVTRNVQEFFGRAAQVLINPDEVVALGAAMQAHFLTHPARARQTLPFGDAAPDLDLPVAPRGAPPQAPSPLPLPRPPSLPVPRAPSVPAPEEDSLPPILQVPQPSVREPESLPESLLESLHESLPEPSIHRADAPPAAGPEEVADPNIEGVPLDERPHLLVDVTPFSLCVETAGGFRDVLIGRNSPVPCDQSRVFTTAKDGQVAVSVRVAQGESPRFEENTYLGAVELSGLVSRTRGEVRLNVTFELDVNGMLKVSAKDAETGRQSAVRLRLLGANTDADDVKKMLARGAKHAVV
jgi:molecular chaperone DnaK